MMRNLSPTTYLFLVLYTLFISASSYAQNNDSWHIYQLDNLSLNETKVYADKPTISGATYSVSRGATLDASKYDRMLFIIDSATSARTNHETINLESGDVLFLKANDAITFSKEVKVMLWTSKSTKTDHKSKTKKYPKEAIESERDSSENVWNSFIETETMVAGLYMLPKSLNGDGTLIHDFDEINYVVNGSAKFKMDNTVIDVEPGTIMWVKRGVSHHFYNLSDDFDVFILFETINMNQDY